MYTLSIVHLNQTAAAMWFSSLMVLFLFPFLPVEATPNIEDVTENIIFNALTPKNNNRDDECRENRCIFPFNFRGQRMDSCVDLEHFNPWCSTLNDESGEMLRWKICGECEHKAGKVDIKRGRRSPSSLNSLKRFLKLVLPKHGHNGWSLPPPCPPIDPYNTDPWWCMKRKQYP